MVGFPVVVGAVLWKMNRDDAHSDPEYVQSFGWVYGACEAPVFYYGWLAILRRTAFVLIGQLSDVTAQSTCAIVLLAWMWVFHVKLEPYKDYFLDLLDMVLLGSLFTIALSSLAFSTNSGTWWVLRCWEYIIYALAVFCVVAFALALFHEAEAKALRTKVKLIYMQKMPSSLAALEGLQSNFTKVSGIASRRLSIRRGADGEPLRLNLKGLRVGKVGSRGKILLGSLLNSLTTPAVRHGFSGSEISARRLRLLADVTGSAGQFLDHCSVHSFMSKKPEARFFRTLVAGFPEVLDIMCCLDDLSLPDINSLRKGLAFLARASERIAESRTPPLYATIRECDLGAIVAFLVTKASEYERKALGEVLAGLLKGYQPISFRESSLTPRVLNTIRGRSSSRIGPIAATGLEVGVRVHHPIRGHGQVIDFDYADERGKPYLISFETGGEHHCNSPSSGPRLSCKHPADVLCLRLYGLAACHRFCRVRQEAQDLRLQPEASKTPIPARRCAPCRASRWQRDRHAGKNEEPPEYGGA
jgi:hypothetical protein